MTVCLLPKSRGSVYMADPDDIAIDPNYLADKSDMECMKKGRIIN